MVSLGKGGSGQMSTWTHSIMFIHTNKKWDDAPRQLTVLHVCLISLRPLMMCLACIYFKLSISCAFTYQVLLYMLVNMLCPSSLFVHYVCLCFVKNV